MRIIGGKISDYYDSARGYGIDPNLVYIRNSRTANIKHVGNWNTEQEFSFTRKTIGDWNIETFLIGFCGQLYPVAVACESGYHHFNGTGDRKYKYFYDFQTYKAFALEAQKVKPKWQRRSAPYSPTSVETFFKRYDGKKTDELFLKYDAPVLVIGTDDGFREVGGFSDFEFKDGVNVLTNPLLKDFGFAGVKDPYTAFQEISMYLGNQLVKSPQIEQVADKYRIAGHGFDKHSFRNPIRVSKLK
jgi:hypothetical protein